MITMETITSDNSTVFGKEIQKLKTNSISLLFISAYMRSMKKILLSAVIILLCFAVLAIPVSATIQPSVTTNFDADGKTSAFGEEVATTLVISAGENDIKDLAINFRNVDAFIDYNSFKKEINPAGASVNITPTANGFSIDSLPKGVVVTITFNAYPKTIQPDTITLADVGFSYTQLGQRFEPSTATPILPITVDLKGSSFHNYEKSQGGNLINSSGLIIGVIVGVVAIIALVLVYFKKRETALEIVRIQENKNKLFLELYRKVELAENNPAEYDSLKKRLRDEMGAGASPSIEATGGTDAKTPPRDHSGGFE